MINTTEFPSAMRHMMTTIEKIYDYPVDIEFTVNFTREEKYKINIVQCRPLQTKIIGEPVAMPDKWKQHRA